MHLTVCKRCHRVLALSTSNHGKEGKHAIYKKVPENFTAIKLIPEAYRFHMAFCAANKSSNLDIYDTNEEVMRYDLIPRRVLE